MRGCSQNSHNVDELHHKGINAVTLASAVASRRQEPLRCAWLFLVHWIWLACLFSRFLGVDLKPD